MRTRQSRVVCIAAFAAGLIAASAWRHLGSAGFAPAEPAAESGAHARLLPEVEAANVLAAQAASIARGDGDADGIARLDAMVRGRLVGADGGPCRGLGVAWCASAHGERSDVATTDAHGRFECAARAGHRGAIVLAAAGFVLEHEAAAFAAVPGENELGDLVVVAAAGVGGRMSAADGGPLAGTILVRHERRDSAARTVQVGTDGAFAIVGLPPGRHALLASAPGHLPYLLPCDLAAGQVLAGVSLELVRGARAIGTVVDDRGVPVANACVAVARPRPDGAGSATDFALAVAADEQGRFAVDGLPRDGGVLAAWSAAHGPVVLEVREPGAAVLRIERHGAVAGSLRDADGRALAASWIAARRIAPPTAGAFAAAASRAAAQDYERTAVTDVEGRFELAGLPAGRWQLRATGAHVPVDGCDVEVGAGAIATVELRAEVGEALAVCVEDAEGRPVAGALVSLDAVAASGSQLCDTRTSDAAGAVTFTNLRAGQFRVAAEHRAHVRSQPVDAGVPASAAPLRVRLGRGGIAALRAHGDGAGAAYGVLRCAAPPQLCWRGRLDADGASTCVLAPGSYVAVPLADLGGFGAVADAVLPADGVPFAIAAGATTEVPVAGRVSATLRGTVRDRAVVLAGVDVRLFARSASEPELFAAPRGRTARSDASGGYAIEGLRPGRYVVTFARRGAAFATTAELEVAAGQRDARVDADLAGGTLAVDVRDEASQAPLPGLRVSIHRTAATARVCRVLPTDVAGRAHWADLPAGSYGVEVHAAERLVATRTIEVGDDARAELAIAIARP